MAVLVPRPKLVRPVWGGETLGARFGKGDGPGDRIGESWEVWRENEGGTPELPILVKLLDVRGRLSVQVHPDDAWAQHLEGAPHGKTEGWVVLDAAPGARVAYGLARAMDQIELADRARSGEIEADLVWRPLRTGDLVDLPAGTIHAIDGAVLLYEVQQPCDITYRLYDWGRPRELHLDRAVQVANRTPVAPSARARRLDADREEVLRSPWFVVERVRLGARRRSVAWESLTVIEGTATIEGVEVREGATVLIDAGEREISGRGTGLMARVPGA